MAKTKLQKAQDKRREYGWRRRGIEGMTVERYDEMLKGQNGKCGICNKKPKTKRLAVDHDHKSHQARGLLCDYCNRRVLGRHTLEKLRAAVDYLERHYGKN